MTLQDKEAQKIRSKEELLELFTSAGVDLQRPVMATCGSGKISSIYRYKSGIQYQSVCPLFRPSLNFTFKFGDLKQVVFYLWLTATVFLSL